MAGPGRPKKSGPLLDEKLTVLVTAQIIDDLRNRANQERRFKGNISEVAREGIEHELYNRLPVLGRIPCGPLQHAIAESDRYQAPGNILRWRAGDFFLQAEGDSMSPRIEDSDFVLMRPGVQWFNGEICAVQVYRDKDGSGDCEATLKRFYQEPGESVVVLRGYNPKSRPITVDAECVKIIAVYRGHIHLED